MPSIRPLAILLSNQRRMPSQWRFGVRRIDDRFEPAVGGPEVPLLEEARRRRSRGLVVEVLECQAYLVGSGGPEMARRETVELRALPLRQVGRVAQPDIACATQQALAFLFGAAHLIDGVVDDL